jgi:hypothetical protein
MIHGKAIPDVIVHRRNCNKHNIIYMEFKPKSNSSNMRDDYTKLRNFTSTSFFCCKDGSTRKYAHQHGISVVYDNYNVELLYFTAGVGPIEPSYKYNTSSWERE